MANQVEIQKVTSLVKGPDGKSLRDEFGRLVSKTVGFRVQVLLYGGMANDGMWDRITHCCTFESAAEAEKLADRVLAALRSGKGFRSPVSVLKLDQWLWSPSRSAVWSFMHARPTAAEKFVSASTA